MKDYNPTGICTVAIPRITCAFRFEFTFVGGTTTKRKDGLSKKNCSNCNGFVLFSFSINEKICFDLFLRISLSPNMHAMATSSRFRLCLFFSFFFFTLILSSFFVVVVVVVNAVAFG